MTLKLKAFIYRLSAVFRLRIYLADKEENNYIKSLGKISEIAEDCSRGLWQAQHGFTTIWTHRQTFLKATYNKLKHAFKG